MISIGDKVTVAVDIAIRVAYILIIEDNTKFWLEISENKEAVFFHSIFLHGCLGDSVDPRFRTLN